MQLHVCVMNLDKYLKKEKKQNDIYYKNYSKTEIRPSFYFTSQSRENPVREDFKTSKRIFMKEGEKDSTKLENVEVMQKILTNEEIQLPSERRKDLDNFVEAKKTLKSIKERSNFFEKQNKKYQLNFCEEIDISNEERKQNLIEKSKCSKEREKTIIPREYREITHDRIFIKNREKIWNQERAEQIMNYSKRSYDLLAPARQNPKLF